MAYITNVDEVVPALRERLRDYLVLKLGIEPNAKRFRCFVHEDNDPSMYFNPKTGDQTVTCFACGAKADIFAAAAHLEGLPDNGPDWVTTTIPHLAELLEIPVQTGEPTAADREKLKLFKLAQDIADLLATTTLNQDYLEERGWTTDDITIGSISEEELISSLMEKGWDSTFLVTSLMIRTSNSSFFGENKVTFTIRDYRGRPVAFVSRNLEESGPKYVNTHETVIYEKRKTLLGLDTAIREGQAKRNGVFVVEGPGDLAQLYRVGIYNAVAVCGTAFTQDHLALLKMLGISRLFFSLDWDSAGAVATARILKEELSGVSGLSCWVVEPPTIKNPEGDLYGDCDELLQGKEEKTNFCDLEIISAFEWLMRNVSDNQDPVDTCAELIPAIASETTAIQRDRLARILCDYTKVSLQAIMADVETLRSGKLAQRRERLKAAGQKYLRAIETDPENIQALMSQHEEDISMIEKEYQRDIIGVNYQISRYDALQQKRLREATSGAATEFVMKRYNLIGNAFAGGMDWTSGVLVYLGGRPNSGKTATGIGIAVDIAMHDEDAIVVTHFTDDNYTQVEPRFKTNIAEMLRLGDEPELSIGMIANPIRNCDTQDEKKLYERANDVLRDLISAERLIIVDAEDGSTLSTLEKNLRYIRSRHPDKKVFVLSDNTHNYRDFPTLDQTSRMRQISTIQADLAVKYHCCMMATVEYRKNMPFDTTKMKLPVDDDIADARALMYRPNAIIHVYNDLHDRKEAAEIFWIRNDQRQPRLMLIFSKNKITEFKDKLMMDLNTRSVTLTQKPKEAAYEDFETFVKAKDSGEVDVRGDQIVYVDASF